LPSQLEGVKTSPTQFAPSHTQKSTIQGVNTLSAAVYGCSPPYSPQLAMLGVACRGKGAMGGGSGVEGGVGGGGGATDSESDSAFLFFDPLACPCPAAVPEGAATFALVGPEASALPKNASDSLEAPPLGLDWPPPGLAWPPLGLGCQPPGLGWPEGCPCCLWEGPAR